MKKLIITLALLAIATSAQAENNGMTLVKLHKLTNSEEKMERIFAATYIVGVADGMKYAEDFIAKQGVNPPKLAKYIPELEALDIAKKISACMELRDYHIKHPDLDASVGIGNCAINIYGKKKEIK